MKWERRYTETNPGDQGGSQEKKDISKEEQSDMLKKKGGGDMPPEIDYEKIGREFEKATEKLLEKFVAPERETKRIQEVVKEEVPKVVGTEVDQRIEKLKTSLIEEVKGLSEEDATKLVDTRIGELTKEACEDPNSPYCQMAKQTAKVVVDEVLKNRKEEKKPFEMPKISPEYEEKWNRLTPEERKVLTLIPAKAHKTMLEILVESPESYKGLNKEILTRLIEEEITEIVKENPDIVTKLPGVICTTPECKEAWNKAVEASEKIKAEEKPHWLLK